LILVIIIIIVTVCTGRQIIPVFTLIAIITFVTFIAFANRRAICQYIFACGTAHAVDACATIAFQIAVFTKQTGQAFVAIFTSKWVITSARATIRCFASY